MIGMQMVLWKIDEEVDSSKLNKYSKGNCGLFFINKDQEEIISYFKEYSSLY